MLLPRVQNELKKHRDESLFELGYYLTEGDGTILGSLSEPVGRLLGKAIASRGIGHIEIQVGTPVFIPSLKYVTDVEHVSPHSKQSRADAKKIVTDMKALLEKPAMWFDGALARGNDRFDCPRYRARFMGEKDPLERDGV